MPRVCSKIRCPNRVSYGNYSDKDVIALVCARCETLYFESEYRKKREGKTFKIITLLTFITLSSMLFLLNNDFQFPWQRNTPYSTLVKFFRNLNNKEYEKAYVQTRHTNWNTLERFKDAFKNWDNIAEVSFESRSYYASYRPDTIINARFLLTKNGELMNIDYDFLLNKINNKWKIIRIYNARNAVIDALKKEELPADATAAVNLFLDFLGQRKVKKAYLLSNNKGWGNEEKFISDWGCIDQIIKYKIQGREKLKNGQEIIYAHYYASDPCNESREWKFFFYMSQSNGLWKIIKVKTA